MEQTEKIKRQNSISVFDSLNTLGFETQFKATERGLLSLKTQKTYKPYELKFVQYFRFESYSNPSDSSTVYAIETIDSEKGTLVDGYGTSSDSQVSDFMHKVEEIHK